MQHWQPCAELKTLRTRAEWLARMRDFFAQHAVLEVETPQLSGSANTDAQLASMAASTAFGQRWLHTSPEFAMKRLLAAGSGAIYQLCKVFRDAEAGRLHNPEFSLLEWYRPGFDLPLLIDEVAELVAALTQRQLPCTRLSYQAALLEYADIDPFSANPAQLRNCLQTHQVPLPDAVDANQSEDVDFWLDLLMGEVVGPQLGNGGLCFVHSYPASQAALARIQPNSQPEVAERFELYWQGVELANGYHELSDASEQEQRFKHDNQRRAALGRAVLPIDQNLLAALVQGLPDCSGVALGFDRLLMCHLGLTELAPVLSFDWGNA